MNNKHIIFTFLLFLMSTTIVAAANNPQIAFSVSFSEPQAHYAEVEMRISNLKKKEVEIAMPVWAPGSYLIREFSKNVESFEAHNNQGKALAFIHKTKNTWTIKADGSNDVVVNYRVYAFEISVRTSFIDASHAFLSPTGMFMYIKGALDLPATVTVKPYANWTKISTGLDKVEGKSNTFYAKNFDWLFDSPIEVGNQDVFEFEAAGVKHEFAMVGGGNYDKEILKEDVAKIIEKETDIYGENPNKRYVFIVHNYKSNGGGLEHLNSCVLGASRDNYSDPTKYSEFLSLVAHEYFHLWNVKRLRPEALGPFDYDKENYTTDLWIAEGFTAYYDNMMIRRTNAISKTSYLQLLTSDINLIENLEGAKVQSVADASFYAWVKYYRPNENSINTSVSYYNKGALLAAMLDLAIINHSNAEKSLDEVMKTAYNEFYKTRKRGYSSEEFKVVLEKVSGENLDTFYKNYVYGITPLDYDTYLNYAGLKLALSEDTPKPTLGITMKDNVVTKILRNTAAWNAGINVNDEILAIDNQRVSNINDYINSRKIGDELQVLISRDGILETIPVRLFADGKKTWKIEKQKEISKKQEEVYRKWLHL